MQSILFNGVLVLNPSQMKRYQKPPPGSTVALPFKHEHLQRNMHGKGGFLPLLAAVLACIIDGGAGGLIEKEIAGSGVHLPKVVWSKRSGAFQINPAHNGYGLNLPPWKHIHTHLDSDFIFSNIFIFFRQCNKNISHIFNYH